MNEQERNQHLNEQMFAKSKELQNEALAEIGELKQRKQRKREHFDYYVAMDSWIAKKMAEMLIRIEILEKELDGTQRNTP